MEDLKAVIAENITQLRRTSGMTQAELAKKLNYTDKAVSKWERHESLPDITVLKAIADCFGVTVDYLISSEHETAKKKEEENSHERNRIRIKNRGFITGMSILLVWLIACIAFVTIKEVTGGSCLEWLPLVYGIPVSMIVWLVLNSTWFNARRNFLIVSFLMWSSLLSIYLTVLIIAINIPLLFLFGIPGQAIIILWSKIRTGKS